MKSIINHDSWMHVDMNFVFTLHHQRPKKHWTPCKMYKNRFQRLDAIRFERQETAKTEEVGRKKHRLNQPTTRLSFEFRFRKVSLKMIKTFLASASHYHWIAVCSVMLCFCLFNIFVKIYCLHRTKQLIHSSKETHYYITTMWIKGRSHNVLLFFMNRASKMWCFCFAGKTIKNRTTNRVAVGFVWYRTYFHRQSVAQPLFPWGTT